MLFHGINITVTQDLNLANKKLIQIGYDLYPIFFIFFPWHCIWYVVLYKHSKQQTNFKEVFKNEVNWHFSNSRNK